MMPWCTDPERTRRCDRNASSRVAVFASHVALAVLVLALTLAGIVPQGMMRVAGDDGSRLVLCTEEGPRDLWLGPEGLLSDRAPLPEKDHELGKCLAVNYAFAAVQVETLADVGRAKFARFRPVLTSAHWPGFSVDPARAPRAPPVSALA